MRTNNSRPLTKLSFLPSGIEPAIINTKVYMRKVFQSIAPLRPALAAAALLFCCQSQAQTNIATTLAELQDDLINGTTYILLQYTGTLYPTGVLEIVEPVTIDATGYNVIIGGTSNQAFYVDPGVNFTLINVTLSGAYNAGAAGTVGANGANASGNGNGGAGSSGGSGGNALGGAVYNAGNSSFIDCLFLTNFVIGGVGGAGGNGGNGGSGLDHGGNGGNGGNGGVGYGGAIYNLGTLLLSNCTFAGNIATGGAGGVGGTNGSGSEPSYPGAGGAGGGGLGAGIYNLGNLTIVNSTLNQNSCLSGTSQTGGGSPGENGNGNPGPAGPASEGGGVCNFGTNFCLNCTFFANTVTGGNGGNGGGANTNDISYGGNGGNGGNAYGGGLFNGGIVAVTNCTFSGNVVVGGTNGVAGPGNYAGNSGSPGLGYGANIENSATFLLKNSILDFPTNATSAYGAITDQGNNISSDATPAFTTTNSFNNKNPQLSPSQLQANGSIVVLTIALSANSPAINAIYDGSAPAYDERGFVRPGQIRPDIGAFEFGSYTPTYDVSGTVTIGGNPFPGVPVSVGLQATTITDSNGNFAFSLPQANSSVIHPNPEAYFNPSSTDVYVSNNITGLRFYATNAMAFVTNGTGTNTNTLFMSFAGIPSLPNASPVGYSFNYIIQAATNLSTNPVVWTNLATNNSGSNGIIPFSYSLSGTNLTNFPRRFFRAVIP